MNPCITKANLENTSSKPFDCLSSFDLELWFNTGRIDCVQCGIIQLTSLKLPIGSLKDMKGQQDSIQLIAMNHRSLGFVPTRAGA